MGYAEMIKLHKHCLDKGNQGKSMGAHLEECVLARLGAVVTPQEHDQTNALLRSATRRQCRVTPTYNQTVVAYLLYRIFGPYKFHVSLTSNCTPSFQDLESLLLSIVANFVWPGLYNIRLLLNS
jgi:hypothetical protein